MDSKEKGTLYYALSQAEADDLQVSFTGEYNLKVLGVEAIIPLVIAQTLHELSELKYGVLLGKIYDSSKCAIIKGAGYISSNRIDFYKQYKTESLFAYLQKEFDIVKNILFPTRKVLPASTKIYIRHEGESSDGGKSFSGTWEYLPYWENLLTR